MANKRYIKGNVEIVLGVLLIAAALILTGRNMWEGYRAKAASDEIMASISNAVIKNENMPPDYMLNSKVEMPIKRVGGTGYIAILGIPELELELPIAEEWSYEKLRVSPCRYIGSIYQKNMVIAAHNYDSHFGRLYTLSAGDRLTLKDMDGNLFEYEVVEVTTLAAAAIRDMTESGYDLTLFTCTSGGYARVTVRCTLV